MKNSEEGWWSQLIGLIPAHIGDTVCIDREVVEPLPGFKPMKAMVNPLTCSTSLSSDHRCMQGFSPSIQANLTDWKRL